MKRTRKKMGNGKSTKVRDLKSDLSRNVSIVLGRALNPQEEKVVRMRYGIRATPDHKLASIGQDTDFIRHRLDEMEKRTHDFQQRNRNGHRS
ncbi:MAG: RNA polymerase sigma factor [Candidatus Magasanikbacteria bacterium GW2011_GWC2_41_17]|uniref:RNA polymerase sigma factor n=2 Tax=Candidatus Magasanikiibacteriota TaxID=1752731 RepID=A0A0G0WL37_9BACT|nr:MAG: RNA polymerase sigma factor [Candidatus Magasanikbacteria bacterium GW2011_GWC2_41_17]KKS13529.1 MAG: RNA polymerase sigma factor [Candidatus Magasanikbacteria bacterium GW2011_GWA2_41_55]